MSESDEQLFFPIQVGETEFRYAIHRGAVLRVLMVDGTVNLDVAVLAAKALNCEVVELLSDPPNKSGHRPSHSVVNHKETNAASSPDQEATSSGLLPGDGEEAVPLSPPQEEPSPSSSD
jgi:hypothetical protein